jgi:phosphoribosylformimino-5-aminoimidazole carboxamide ribonucleotide (ProFAR) isomerase
MEFIFMFTRDDQTVEDCLEVFDLVRGTGVKHLGFKDVGVARETLVALNNRIKASGGVSYMEVVSTTSEACLNSTRAAVEIGVDRLLGGTEAEAMLEVLEGSGIAYFPFPGRPEGHPTQLGGTPEQVAADCRHFEALGCAGVDLLAYRATEAEPLDLVRAAREALSGELIIAGSVSTPARVHELAEAGVNAFTVGSAAFDGSFSPRKGSLHSQLNDILAACV